MKPKIEAREFWIELSEGDTGKTPDLVFIQGQTRRNKCVHVLEAEPVLKRIQELEAQSQRQVNMISQLANECNAKDEIIAELKKCLEFYADTKSYEEWTNISLPPTLKNRQTTDVKVDNGKLARKTLASVAKKEGEK